MAKTEAQPAKTPGTSLAAPGDQSKALATGKVDMSILAEDSRTSAADLGIRASDIAIPFLKVAQKMTPQLNKRDPSHIEGLEEGDFFNSVTNERWPGDPGIRFIISAFRPSYTEWRPRDSGGGLVKDHGTDDTVEKQATRNEKKKLVLPNGNHVVPSFMYFGLVLPPDSHRAEQVVFNLAGTQLKKGKKWNALVLGLIVPAEESPTGREMKPPKPWFQSYEVTTVPEKNDQGDWMGLSIKYGPRTLALPTGDDYYLQARSFAELVKAGKAAVKMEEFVEEVKAAADAESEKAF